MEYYIFVHENESPIDAIKRGSPVFNSMLDAEVAMDPSDDQTYLMCVKIETVQDKPTLEHGAD